MGRMWSGDIKSDRTLCHHSILWHAGDVNAEHGADLQFWARTPVASSVFYDHQITAKSTVQTLGVSMGGVPRKPTEEEERRSEAVALKARRIATLPGSQRLKVGVASSVLSNKMVWGVIFNGRCPTDSESKAFQQLWRGAVQGFDNMGGHDCRHLTAIFKMGHTSDLVFFGMSALHECPAQMVPVSTTGFPTPFLFFFPRDETSAW